MTTSDEHSSNDRAVEFFHTLVEAKQVAAPKLIELSHPRLIGLILGTTLGLVYGFVSQVINVFLMPGVPFAQYPFGVLGNCVVIIISAAFISLVSIAPRSSVTGAFLGSAVAVLAALLQWWVVNAPPSTALFNMPFLNPLSPLALILVFMLFLPVLLFFRLAVTTLTESSYKPVWSWTRLRLPLVIFVLAGMVGAFSLFPNHVRQAMTDMHALIQTGLSASNAGDLPPSLWQENGVTDFLSYASSDYILAPSESINLKSDLGASPKTYSLAVIARFKNNWILTCLYDVNGQRAHCKSYAVAPSYLKNGFDGSYVGW